MINRLNHLVFHFLLATLLLSSCKTEPAQNLYKLEAVPVTSTPIVVRILNLDAVKLSSPTASPVPAAEPEHTATKWPTSTKEQLPPQATLSPKETSKETCTNRAAFIKHILLSDDTVVEGGNIYVKAWRIMNTGSCTWTDRYSLVSSSAELTNLQNRVFLERSVLPGEEIDIQVKFSAPTDLSIYSSEWLMSDSYGNTFGFGENGSDYLTIKIKIKPTPRPTPG